MLRFLADQNFNNNIIRGLQRRQPELDIVCYQDVGVFGTDDSIVLEFAAKDGRVLLTHDVAKITQYVYQRLEAGLSVPGVFQVGFDVPIIRAIEDILLLAEYSLDGEWEGQVRYLPL
ncbi:DUF5615 family PIN-like protein [Planktothrix sp. FACHB-1355]|uniref:DUF5615 family PIN-like protein n=1 Tax=Aerosakkonema funiforme FACHB-1375 TaxID=2949571 RepID=A0A926VA12_9CYAN|nr:MULTISPECIES: DUF5615 family PIN-like protein [Oscillatoriales]MBD2179951.1 DUF5615 family PIN-like protein [Aerosakkonema funiforme FACHB-1375]MBD3559553.1 DUF5615 family PIN-like protein [Planktothrix sp. FACHB-1355]